MSDPKRLRRTHSSTTAEQTRRDQRHVGDRATGLAARQIDRGTTLQRLEAVRERIAQDELSRYMREPEPERPAARPPRSRRAQVPTALPHAPRSDGPTTSLSATPVETYESRIAALEAERELLGRQSRERTARDEARGLGGQTETTQPSRDFSQFSQFGRWVRGRESGPLERAIAEQELQMSLLRHQHHVDLADLDRGLAPRMRRVRPDSPPLRDERPLLLLPPDQLARRWDRYLQEHPDGLPVLGVLEGLRRVATDLLRSVVTLLMMVTSPPDPFRATTEWIDSLNPQERTDLRHLLMLDREGLMILGELIRSEFENPEILGAIWDVVMEPVDTIAEHFVEGVREAETGHSVESAARIVQGTFGFIELLGAVLGALQALQATRQTPAVAARLRTLRRRLTVFLERARRRIRDSRLGDLVRDTRGSSGPFLMRGSGLQIMRFRAAAQQAMQRVRQRQIRTYGRSGGRTPQEVGRWVHEELEAMVRSGQINLPGGFPTPVAETPFRHMGNRFQIPQAVLDDTVHDFVNASRLSPGDRAVLLRRYGASALVRDLTPDLILEEPLGQLTVIDLMHVPDPAHVAKTRLYAEILRRSGREVGYMEFTWR